MGIAAPFKTCTGMHEASDTGKTGTVQTITLSFWKINDQQQTRWSLSHYLLLSPHLAFPTKPGFPKLPIRSLYGEVKVLPH